MPSITEMSHRGTEGNNRLERQMLGIGGKLEELLRLRTQEGGASPSSLVPTLAQNTQQQGAGADQNVQDPLVLFHDADQLLHQLCGPRQVCGARSTGEARVQLGCVTQT